MKKRIFLIDFQEEWNKNKSHCSVTQ